MLAACLAHSTYVLHQQHPLARGLRHRRLAAPTPMSFLLAPGCTRRLPPAHRKQTLLISYSVLANYQAGGLCHLLADMHCL